MQSRNRVLLRKRWREMIRRCTSPSAPTWEHYGGRGIRVCAEWLDDFEAFAAHVGEIPPGMWLDRIDNDADYRPGNVRWASPKEQANNRRPRSVPTVMAVQNAAKTHCPQGHPYDGANVFIDTVGGRRCLICTRVHAREANQRYRARKALAQQAA